MLTLPGHAVLDKVALIGGCARLPLRFDLARLRAEVAALPAQLWGSRGGRIGVHMAAQAVFLRGYAPAEGNLPIEDREALQHLPYVREIIGSMISAPPLRCLMAMLPAGGTIMPHMDQGDYFSKTIRIHIPVTTNPNVWMFCADRSYHMQAGEIWALNNSTVHAVWNADPALGRIHLICDFLPSAHLLELLAGAQRDLGTINRVVEQRLFEAQPAA